MPKNNGALSYGQNPVINQHVQTSLFIAASYIADTMPDLLRDKRIVAFPPHEKARASNMANYAVLLQQRLHKNLLQQGAEFEFQQNELTFNRFMTRIGELITRATRSSALEIETMMQTEIPVLERLLEVMAYVNRDGKLDNGHVPKTFMLDVNEVIHSIVDAEAERKKVQQERESGLLRVNND